MKKSERALRESIVERCRAMSAAGLGVGTAGNISARFEERMLITPTGVAYDALEPADLASTALAGDGETWDGPLVPSSEWRFHLGILQARPEIGAVIHTHSTHATALAIARRALPACHYMIAAAGGPDVRCADYASYGTAALSENVLRAMENRSCCLLANHGAIATGPTLAQAFWLAVELEEMARQYILAESLGGAVILPDEEIAEMVERFKGYGPRDRGGDENGGG